MDKDKTLEEIAREIERCDECKKDKFGLPVPGEGNSDAKVMFIGMAPGREESKTGKPFVGRAGKLLTQLLDSIGIKREEVFITSPVKYYPGKRAPTSKEIEHGKVHFLKQIKIIKPKLIVLLGNVALKSLDFDDKISEVHGKIIKRENVNYFPTFHPAAGVRFLKIKKEIQKDFKKLKSIYYKIKMKTLKRKFFIDLPDIVAKNLLGKILVRKLNGKILSGRIVETEAYFGEKDPSSRAYLGRPKYCVKLMHDVPGKTLVYNVHNNWLFNIVAHTNNEVGAVLIRALEPLEGIEEMKENRKVDDLYNLTNGPGKLAKSLGITDKHNSLDITQEKSEILIVDNQGKFEICSSHRIGVTRDLKRKLRFYIENNPFVSK
jgi:uracil-DNA glycosylase family 4/DNA-3-methyladenine glycosylase